MLATLDDMLCRDADGPARCLLPSSSTIRLVMRTSASAGRVSDRGGTIQDDDDDDDDDDDEENDESADDIVASVTTCPCRKTDSKCAFASGISISASATIRITFTEATYPGSEHLTETSMAVQSLSPCVINDRFTSPSVLPPAP